MIDDGGSSPNPTVPAPRPTILIVDDEPVNRLFLRGVLAEQEAEVIEASAGEEALALLDAGTKIDLILLDVMLSGMDGIQLCRRIKLERNLVHLPVVVVTSLADNASRVAGKIAGADEFLTWPVDPLELNARVRTLLHVKAYHDLRLHQRQRLEEALARTRENLIRADRLATVCNLAAATSHEMKNILVVLNGTIDGIRDATARDAPVDPQRIEALETVAAHLLTHARQLDGVGRQGHDGEPTRIELGTAVRETMDMMRAAVAKHARIVVRKPDRALFVEVERTRLQQVLVNLIYNAVAACEEAGRSAIINVTLEADEHRASCRVADNGPGIAPEIMPNLFDMYFTTKGAKGSGIGLAVAKSIVEAAGGQITVESQLGDGAAFTFTLPLAQRR